MPFVKVSILNIVFGCPERAEGDETGEDATRSLATFYAELLGLRILRDDWMVVGKDRDTMPRLAFGDGPSEEYRAPRWPDPDYPQQVHLDLSVPDLDAAEARVLGLGATRLQDQGAFRSYADPVGHPFCLYQDDVDTPRIERIVFDCFSPRALAGFYEELLQMKRVMDTPERVEIAGEAPPGLAFQHAPEYLPPRWPDPRYPQQIHLDLDVDDPDPALELVERLGGIRLPEMGGSCPVYADPAAHPFCLCGPGQ
jgi:catechol 2,3-dioxygenase-like lactoylglutathione lyase family enzyme